MWETRNTADAFADYAGYVAEKLSDRARALFFTLNECATFVELGHASALEPDGQFRVGRRILLSGGPRIIRVLCGTRPVQAFLTRGESQESFSRRKCCSRDSGDRHIPARRWCSEASARYSAALIMISSYAISFVPA